MPQRLAYWLGRQSDRHRVLTTVLALTLVAGPGYLALQHNADQDVARQAQNSIDDGYVSCLRGNDSRQVLTDVVKIAYDSGGSLDFTKVPAFNNLDAATREFFLELRDLTSAAPDPAKDPESARNRALAKLTLRDCEAEFPHHSPGLTVSAPPAAGDGP